MYHQSHNRTQFLRTFIVGEKQQSKRRKEARLREIKKEKRGGRHRRRLSPHFFSPAPRGDGWPSGARERPLPTKGRPRASQGASPPPSPVALTMVLRISCPHARHRKKKEGRGLVQVLERAKGPTGPVADTGKGGKAITHALPHAPACGRLR